MTAAVWCDRDHPAKLVSISARVGSIADNSLGGWYSCKLACMRLYACCCLYSLLHARRYCQNKLEPAQACCRQNKIPDARLMNRQGQQDSPESADQMHVGGDCQAQAAHSHPAAAPWHCCHWTVRALSEGG